MMTKPVSEREPDPARIGINCRIQILIETNGGPKILVLVNPELIPNPDRDLMTGN
jgi:hypothetical protein